MFSAIRRHPFLTLFIISGTAFFALAVYFSKTIDAAGGEVRIPIGRKIAIIEVSGTILSSKELVEQIIAVRNSEQVKAVVVRINSPGGGVAPSQEIHAELVKLNEKKPVVASLSSVAASGGYYVAVAARKIVANPGTLTGSIGVIMDFANIEGLLEKVGLKSFVVKSGKFKDIGSPSRIMTEEEKQYLQQLIDNVHMQFVKTVAEGRKLEVDAVTKLADGRILTGEQALESGLIDELGGLQEAIGIVTELAGLEKDEKSFYFEKEKTMLEYLAGTSLVDMLNELLIPQLHYRALNF